MEFLSVNTVEQALEVLASHGGGAAVLAGGTDVMIQLERHEIDPGFLIHVEHLAELSFIRKNGGLHIGALATHRRLAESASSDGEYTAISTAAAAIGGWQTQSVGTIGGNIGNASPAADLAAPLLVHNASVGLASRARGERRLALDDFLRGRRETAREPDELITDFQLEPQSGRTADVYLKVGRRSGMEVAIAGLAVRLTLDEDAETISEARVATCAVGPVARRAAEAEAILKGQKLETDVLRAAGEALAVSSSPIDDARASAAYRRRLLPGLLERGLRICAEKVAVTAATTK